MKLSHEEYVLQQRRKVAKLASDVLKGDLSILKAAIEIVKIRFELDVDENDKDLIAFVAIESEIDHLPIGPERKYWNEDALKEKDKEINESEKWANEFGLEACQRLIDRFGAY